MPPKAKSPETRFLASIHKTEDGCWLWTRAKSNTGYGQFRATTRSTDNYQLAHRWSYQHFKHEIPSGMVVHHKCSNKACVNPEHLECTTYKGNAAFYHQGFWTHCPDGHEYSPLNTLTLEDGQRVCSQCHSGGDSHR